MKVTKLEYQKKDPSRVNMFVDGNFFCGVSLETIALSGIYVGSEFKEGELDKILLKEIEGRFLQRAVMYLSNSLKTALQTRRYLQNLLLKKKKVWYSDLEKDTGQEMIERISKKLKKYGYVNDEVFAEQFVLSRIKNKPRGKQVLIGELLSKGVSKDVAESVVVRIVPDEYEMLKKVYFKKYKEGKLDIQDRKKIAFLIRKGFNWDLIERFANNESEE